MTADRPATGPDPLPLPEGHHVHYCDCAPLLAMDVAGDGRGGKGAGPHGRFTGTPADDTVGAAQGAAAPPDERINPYDAEAGKNDPDTTTVAEGAAAPPDVLADLEAQLRAEAPWMIRDPGKARRAIFRILREARR